MKKRLLAMVLALVLVLGMLPVSVIAEGEHVHCLCGETTVLDATCGACGSKATEWTATDTMPTASGRYYLTGDVAATPFFCENMDIALCLHSHTVSSPAGRKFLYLNKNATYSISDCTASYAADGTYTAGRFTGASTDIYGSTMRANAGCVLNLYDGKITGNSAKDDGVIYVDGSKTSTPGGTFNMYGGEVSGNTARRGVIFGVSTGVNMPVIRILGGKVTGNTGTGTGTFKGGAAIYAFSSVEVGGKAVVADNTAAEGPADIYLRNDGTFAGQLVVSSDVPLKSGANICYAMNTADTDGTNLTSITGTPTSWNSDWVTCDGQSVAYADGKFYFGTGVLEPNPDPEPEPEPEPEPDDGKHIHCLCGAAKTLDATCASCGSKAVEWTASDTVPNTTGYYYLTGNVSTGAVVYTGGVNTNLCLDSHTVSSTAGKKIAYIAGGSSLTVTDCAETAGTITGVKNEPVIQVSNGSAFYLYGGKISGNSTTGDGVILLEKGNTTKNGGTFVMYGGEISGNTVKRGAVMMTNATGTAKSAIVRILGGTITGNHATGTAKSNGGGAGIVAMAPVEVGGNAKIYGNTAVAGPADIYIRNDQRGALVISSEKPLTGDAQIGVGLYTAEADQFNLQYVTGSPATWNTSWVTYEGEELRYEDGKFLIGRKLVYSDHAHDGKTWFSVTNDSGMEPNVTGYYVLDGDVTLKSEMVISDGQDVVLCLNGHTLTAASGSRHFDVESGATLTICDCTAVTSGDTYTAGAITGGNCQYGGGSVRIRAGATVNLYDGCVTGNHTDGEGGAFCLDGCTAAVTTPAVLNMYGGEISGNTATKGYGAAIRLAGATAGAAGTFHMEGGRICDHVSANYGGALHAPGNATIELLGGVIENNTCVGGTVSINGTTKVILDGTVIRNNSAEKWGGGVYLKGGATMTMSSGEITGNSAKIGAGILMETEGTTLKLTGGKISGNKVGTAGGGGVYVGAGCVMTMDGGEISKNSSEAGGAGVMTATGTFTMNGGEICENTTVKGGAGVMCNSKSVFTMNGGNVCHNEADSWGAGLIVSESTFTMNGGKINNNYTHQSGAGIYVWKGQLVLNKGSVYGNLAQMEAGGIRMVGSTLELNGAWITSNRTIEGNGGGVLADYYKTTSGGKTTITPSRIVMNGGSISHNTAGKGMGGVLLQYDGTTMDMYGGKISGNHAYKYVSGVYAGKGTSFSMHGGEVSYNTLDTNGVAGVFHVDSTGNYTGGEIYGNVSPGSGGALGVSGAACEVHVKGLKIYDNTAKVAAGILTQSTGTLHLEDCEIYNNISTLSGGAVYMYSYTTMTMKNCKVYGNEAKSDGGGIWMWATAHLTLDDCEIYDNRSLEGNGGGIWTRGDTVTIRNTTIRDNTAAGSGGGIYTGMMGSATLDYVEYLTMENAVIRNNTAGKQGGAIYLSVGSKAKLYDTLLVDNTAAAEGGAIWAKEDLTMHSVTATGNTSGGEGYAVYLDSSDYDGNSYYAGILNLSGDMQIHSNQGGDLYLGKQVPVIIREALSDSARMEINMHSGLLTQWVWGAYNYEGGNQVYTVTAGNRSITEPEATAAPEEEPATEPTEQPTEAPETEPTQAPTEGQQEQPKGKVGLIVGIAAVVVVIAAAAVIIVLASKKKKSDK